MQFRLLVTPSLITIARATFQRGNPRSLVVYSQRLLLAHQRNGRTHIADEERLAQPLKEGVGCIVGIHHLIATNRSIPCERSKSTRTT